MKYVTIPKFFKMSDCTPDAIRSKIKRKELIAWSSALQADRIDLDVKESKGGK